MSEIGDKGKAAGEKAKALADAGIEKLKNVDWKAQSESAKEKATAAKDKVVSIWRSGTKGKAICVVAALALIWIGSCLFSDSDEVDASDVDTLVVKGLYMRQHGDSALKACKRMVNSDLVVVDFRKGFECEKTDAQKADDKNVIKAAEEDIDDFLKWNGLRDTPDPSLGIKNCAKCREHMLPALAWNGDKTAPIRGALPVGVAMAELAAIHGYQMEWMLPGKRESAGESKAKPTLTVIAQIMPNDKLVNGGLCVKIARDYDSRRLDDDGLQEVFDQNVFGKGLKVCKEFDGRMFYRLVFKDESGKPLDKKDLAAKLASEYSEYFRGSMSEKLASAEKAVNIFQNWVEVERKYADYTVSVPDPEKTGIVYKRPKKKGKDHDASSKKKPLIQTYGQSVPPLMERMMKDGVYLGAMQGLIAACKPMVEWAMLTEPVDKLEEITETFTIPVKGDEDVQKFLNDLNGKYMRDVSGSIRKQLFFKKGLLDVGCPLQLRLILKDANGKDVAKEDVVKNWLTGRGRGDALSDKARIASKRLIQISPKEKGVRDWELKKWACLVWLDDKDKVQEVRFNEDGLARLFKAGDLSSEEFAKNLISEYPDIPDLEANTGFENLGRGMLRMFSWVYKDPRGYKVELFERAYYGDNGNKYTRKMIENDAQVGMALSLNDKLPKKYLSITAITPQTERKFD